MQDKAEMRFKKRCFSAFEICAFHLENIKSSDDPETALWRILRQVESDRVERFKLWDLVVTCARQFHGVDFVEIWKAHNRQKMISESIQQHRSTLDGLADK